MGKSTISTGPFSMSQTVSLPAPCLPPCFSPILQHPGDIGSFSDSAAVLSCLSCDDVLPGSTTLKGNSKSSDAGKHQPRWDLWVTAGLEKPVLMLLSLHRHHGCIYILYMCISCVYIYYRYRICLQFCKKIHTLYVCLLCMYIYSIILYKYYILLFILYPWKKLSYICFFFNIYILYIYTHTPVYNIYICIYIYICFNGYISHSVFA